MVLKGDINSLVQVLANLISNAIHAQKQVGGGIITLGEERSDDMLRIYVKDTGRGIPEDIRERLFLEMTTTKGVRGTGLGLYISNAAIHGKFNGTMSCENSPAGGAVFYVDIPMKHITPTDEEADTYRPPYDISLEITR